MDSLHMTMLLLLLPMPTLTLTQCPRRKKTWNLKWQMITMKQFTTTILRWYINQLEKSTSHCITTPTQYPTWKTSRYRMIISFGQMALHVRALPPISSTMHHRVHSRHMITRGRMYGSTFGAHLFRPRPPREISGGHS